MMGTIAPGEGRDVVESSGGTLATSSSGASPSDDLRDLPYPPGGGIIHLCTEGEDV